LAEDHSAPIKQRSIVASFPRFSAGVIHEQDMWVSFRSFFVAAVFLVQRSIAETSANQVTAIQKVIQLLIDMQAKSKTAKQAEMVEFATFKQFCIGTTTNKAAEIKEENELVESLSAEISKLEADVEDLGNKIDELQRSIHSQQADTNKAKEQRAKDHASYTQDTQDFAESVDALERAITVLTKQGYDRKQATEALLQLAQSPSLTTSAQQTLAAFVEMDTEDSQGQLLQTLIKAPEANAYEFQSGGILDVLKQLRDEFSEKKAEGEKEEMNSRHAFEMLTQDLTDSIANANSDIEDKTTDRQEKIKRTADDKKQLGATLTNRDEDVAYLKDLKTECSDKTNSYAEKQQLRAEEIDAIGKAIEILGSSAVSGVAKQHLSLLQKAPSFSQLRASSTNAEESPARRAAINFIVGEGRRLHSQQLGMLAEKLSADPFSKVKKLIQDLIARLLEESNQESEQKGFCDKEIGTNKKTRAKLSTTIDELTASVDETTALIAQNSERIAVLHKEVLELNAAMKDATGMRTAEAAKNAETIQDAVEAQKAIQTAVAILNDFYIGAGTATALLLQRPTMGSEEWNALANPDYVTGGGDKTVDKGHKKGMQTFGKVYRGQQSEAGGVLAILEVVASDFASLEVETKTGEDEALRLYREFTASSDQSVAVKQKESEMLDADRAQAQSDLISSKKDLAANQDELLAAGRYYEKLKPSCVTTGVSYEDRGKARQEEIASLQEALQILSGDDIA